MPPQPQYNGSRALPTNKKKEKRIYKISPECDQDPLGNNQPPQRRLQAPSSIFGPRRGYVCGNAPPPEIESQLRACYHILKLHIKKTH